MASATRGPALTTAAVLFGILAVSNLLKPFQLGGEQTGFVFLGERLSGTANTILGPLFGLYLAVYAAGIWRLRPWALPVGCAYAAYVLVNLLLFNVRMPPPPDAGAGWKIFGLTYATVALGVSLGTCWLLAVRRGDLR